MKVPQLSKLGAPGSIGRRAALATAAVTGLAIAAPATPASAATPRVAIQTSAGSPGTAIGPTLIGDTFNGGTVIVTSPSAAVGTVNTTR
jgi:hypothetical protein